MVKMTRQQTLALVIGMVLIALILHFWFVGWGIYCDPDIKLFPTGKVADTGNVQITKCHDNFLGVKIATNGNWTDSAALKMISLDCGVWKAVVIPNCAKYFGAEIREGKESLMWGIVAPIVLLVGALILWFQPQNSSK
ncbi:MAG: hypothetical protein L6R19_04200 [Alphaproteobacteria bacterium]|nr:hypothetical protein [Alphaproteobacteria bacterium]